MQTILNITRAIGDQTRLRILMALRDGELCLCQLIDLLALSPSTVSKHMSVLQGAGLIHRRKEGRWAYFRLAGKGAPTEIRRILRFLIESLTDDPVVEQDAQRLKAIRERDLAQLCECYA